MLQKNDRWCCAGENAWCVFLTQNPCGSPDKVVSLLSSSFPAKSHLLHRRHNNSKTTIRFSLPTTASFTF
jgi:hypothetical protein